MAQTRVSTRMGHKIEVQRDDDGGVTLRIGDGLRLSVISHDGVNLWVEAYHYDSKRQTVWSEQSSRNRLTDRWFIVESEPRE